VGPGSLLYGQHAFVDNAGTYGHIDYPGADATVANGIDDPDTLSGGFDVVGEYLTHDRLGAPLHHGFIAHISAISSVKP
jgi:hypothetical protein